MDRKVDPVTGVNSVEPIRPKRNPKGAPGRLKRRWEDLLEEEERKGSYDHRPWDHKGEEDPKPRPGEGDVHAAAQANIGQDPQEVLKRVKERPLPFLEAHRPKDPKGKVLNSIG
ncbi:hypothetical protein TheveDRAFT_1413 [Thermanaerovibrio velox DSM 12556]|uniref:Uncharacterized protein n=1 Tax=Thermanaerovibrio velox DSM 12556 TaxID=926567 RepID=H0UP28_9BACT|nr:hypothetical protein [Thermanaerovibrio velox]EHM10531.1 hypothetical protein TheveDRAFT_1413 [Thermanaerovibrio velox DSM 12556]